MVASAQLAADVGRSSRQNERHEDTLAVLAPHDVEAQTAAALPQQNLASVSATQTKINIRNQNFQLNLIRVRNDTILSISHYVHVRVHVAQIRLPSKTLGAVFTILDSYTRTALCKKKTGQTVMLMEKKGGSKTMHQNADDTQTTNACHQKRMHQKRRRTTPSRAHERKCLLFQSSLQN